MNDSGIYLARSPGDGGDYLAPLMLTIQVYFSRQTLVDLFSCAAEGGSNYWAGFTMTDLDDEGLPTAYNVTELSEAPRVFHVNAETMAAGIAKLAAIVAEQVAGEYPGPPAPKFGSARRHLADVLNDNADADTADVVLQLATLGEVVYG